MSMTSVNPATGDVIREYPTLSPGELEASIARSCDAHLQLAGEPVSRRAAWLAEAAENLARRRDELGRLMTLEMGKPLSASLAEVDKCAWVCRYYADQAPHFLADEPVDTGGPRTRIRFEPLGPVLAIMPWNFPLWQVFRFAAPALAAGNTGLLKHASNVPGCALAIESVFADTGFPKGAFQAVLITSVAAQRVVADPRIRAITLTGSEPAGQAVARTAGQHLKKTVLELGGSDPFVVLADADVEAAAATAVQARVINNGQSCIAAKRFIVERPVADEFEGRFVEGMQALRMGDPMDADTDLGPLATRSIRDELHDQVQRTVAAGARLCCGGHLPDGPGWYYPATVLADVPPGSPGAVEELFGPVGCLFSADSPRDALRIANDTEFGLGAAAWTSDPSHAAMFVEGIQAGSVFINGMVASDPRLPFGGIKRSGYGRELAGYGMREFVNIKTVWEAV